jgi:hypothetical protein
MWFRFVACALFVSLACVVAQASPGDPFVPAHRTKDGQYVPPNVPPISAGTHLARHPGSSTTAHKAARQPHTAGSAPASAEARSVAR